MEALMGYPLGVSKSGRMHAWAQAMSRLGHGRQTTFIMTSAIQLVEVVKWPIWNIPSFSFKISDKGTISLKFLILVAFILSHGALSEFLSMHCRLVGQVRASTEEVIFSRGLILRSQCLRSHSLHTGESDTRLNPYPLYVSSRDSYIKTLPW